MAQTAPMDFDSIQIHKATIDRLLATDNFVDGMALYMFYIYTARWQKTSVVRAVTSYVSNGISLSEARVRRAKKTLIGLDLIRDKQTIKDNKITGHYVEIRFSFYHDTEGIPHPNDFPQCGKSHSVENHQTNALSKGSLNALSNSKKNAYPFFDEFYSLYPRKAARKDCLVKWIKNGYEEIGETIVSNVKERIKREYTSDKTYILIPLTYLNGERWNDEVIDRMTSNNSSESKYNSKGYIKSDNTPTHPSQRPWTGHQDANNNNKPRHIADVLNGVG